MRLPRIVGAKPQPGAVLPVERAALHKWVVLLGPAATYGLRAIRLRGCPYATPRGLVFAEYLVPGEIVLYAVPGPPWRLSFRLEFGDASLFRRYGAQIDVSVHAGTTRVDWSRIGLEAFYRREVFAHELGHHALQQRKGRQPARRADHEAAADLFATHALSRNLDQKAAA